MRIAAAVAVALLAVVMGFQLALVFGAPLGRAAWGGRHPGRLPGRFRLASGVGALIVYPAIIFAVLGSAGIIVVDWSPVTRTRLLWVLTALFGVGVLANAASRSKVERIWSPVSLGIAVCCAFMASRM